MLEALKTAKKNKKQQSLTDDDEGNKNREASNPVRIEDKQEPDNSNMGNKEN